MRLADGLSAGDIGDEDARADDLIDRGACLGQGCRDDLETSCRLDVWIRINGAVGPDRCRAGYQHAVADPKRSAEPDGSFERRARADPLARAQVLRNGRSSSFSKRSCTAVRSSATSAFRRSCEGVSETLTTRIRRSVVCSAYSPAASLPVIRPAALRISRATSSWP